MPNDVVIDPIGMQELFDGPVALHIFDIAGDVANRAIAHASGRPGPNRVTGDLIKGITTDETDEAGIKVVDVFSTATHHGWDYPSLLEMGYAHPKSGRPVHYPWLLPSMKDIFGADLQINQI